MDKDCIAVDLGASSGRVMQAWFGAERFVLEEVHRFPNDSRERAGHLRWDASGLFRDICAGLQRVAQQGRPVASVGVDTWGVDYGLFDAAGELREDPVCYRDSRTDGAPEQVFASVPRAEIYRRTGIQVMAINTLFQLFAQQRGGGLPAGSHRLLMMPDVFHHFLCGSTVGEYTQATTSQMVACQERRWDLELCRKLGLPTEILPELVEPGTGLGELLPEVERATGLKDVQVVAPATHDTACAVAGTPLAEDVAFISSGTWSLIGVERRQPLVTEESARENFTNEGGVAGTFRFLKNATGMWILEGCRKVWKEQGRNLEWDELCRRMESAPSFKGFVCPDDPAFFNPEDMVAAVSAALRETGQEAPTDPVALAKIVLESVALRYARVLRTIEQLTGVTLRGVRIMGGGSRNDFLNQATADASGLPVWAGPAEATAIGNALVQALAAGRFRDLAEGRQYIERTVPARRFEPRRTELWQAAADRYRTVEEQRLPR